MRVTLTINLGNYESLKIESNEYPTLAKCAMELVSTFGTLGYKDNALKYFDHLRNEVVASEPIEGVDTIEDGNQDYPTLKDGLKILTDLPKIARVGNEVKGTLEINTGKAILVKVSPTSGYWIPLYALKSPRKEDLERGMEGVFVAREDFQLTLKEGLK